MKRQKTAVWLIVLLMVFGVSLVTEREANAEEMRVIFECEDIGVEARRLLDNLRAEQERFREKEERIGKREEALKILEVEVDKKLDRLEETRAEFEALLAEKDEEENEMVRRLGRIYQRRDPAAAAVTLSQMDQELAVSILAVMRDKFAGEILDNMEEEIAVVYSTALGRLGR